MFHSNTPYTNNVPKPDSNPILAHYLRKHLTLTHFLAPLHYASDCVDYSSSQYLLLVNDIHTFGQSLQRGHLASHFGASCGIDIEGQGGGRKRVDTRGIYDIKWNHAFNYE